MNAHIDPAMVAAPSRWDNFRTQMSAIKLNDLDTKRRVGLVALAALLGILLGVALLSGPTSSVSASGSISNDFMTRYNGDMKLISDNIDRLTKDAVETRTSVAKLKAWQDKADQSILQLQQNQQLDPKALELQKQNQDRLQKLLDTPMPSLTPVSPTS